jgi:hypothetical protein
MNLRDITIGLLWFVVAHIAVWFQLNGQFIWESFRKNELLVAATGAIISFFYLWGTKYAVSGFGAFWPVRFSGFAIGIFIYGVLVSIYFDEGLNLKTIVSLLLCLGLIGIQIIWK